MNRGRRARENMVIPTDGGVHVAPSEPPSVESELRINGLSLVFFNFYVLKEPGNDLPSAGLHEVACNHDYRLVLGGSPEDWRSPDTYEFDQSLKISKLQLPSAGRLSGQARLFSCRIGPTLIATTTVVNFVSGRRSFCPIYVMTKSLSVDDVLSAIYQLGTKGSAEHENLEYQRRAAIEAVYGPCDVQQKSSNRRSLIGIEIWDIGNSDISSNKPQSAKELVERFRWEIAALLNYTDDRVRTPGTWRKVTAEEVAQTTSNVRSATGAYAVLTSGQICIEVFQYEMLTKLITPELLARTTERLRAYGYDSTSIYLWGRLATVASVSSHYGWVLSSTTTQVSTLLDLLPAALSTSGSHEQFLQSLSRIVKLKVEVNQVLDETYWRFETLPEKRRADFFRDGSNSLGLGNGIREIDRKMNILNSAFTDISRTLGAIDETRTLKEILDLGAATDKTNRVVLLLNVLLAATTAIEFSGFVSILSGDRLTPLGRGLVAGGSFVSIVLCVFLYYRWSVRRSRS